MKQKKSLMMIMAGMMVLLSACQDKGNQPSASSSPSATVQPSSSASATGNKVSWDITKNVDENFPFEQYVQDEKAKWNVGRKVDFTWYFNYNNHVATKPWTEYEALKTAAEITGINVTGTIPNGDPNEKIHLMMATNDMPDLITLGFGDPAGEELITGGYVYSLDELIDKYAPEFKNEIPQILRDIGTYEDIDNQMWSISGVTNPDWLLKEHKDPIVGNFSYSVRKDIWTELGQPSIATPDDLYNTLKLFKEKYPTIDGKTSIGISGWNKGDGAVQTIGYSFGINDNYCDDATGVCSVKYMNPKYPEFIAFMNKLFREKLLDPEIFIKDEQQVNEDLATSAFMLPYVYHAAGPANAILDSKKADSHFIAIPPMSATGKAFSFPGQSRMGGATQTFITKKNKDPEAAIKLLRYGFSTTGTMQISQGNPGKHYQVKDGVYFRPQAEAEQVEKDVTAYLNKTGIWDYYSLWYQPMPGQRSDSADNVAYDIPNSVPYAHDSTNESYRMTPSGTSDEGIALTTVGKLADNVVKAITASTPEKSAQIVEKMIADMRNVKNYSKLEAYMTDRHKKNVERFGDPVY
ncbi:extracellular solute-binding protein [Cohnella nanjingensis]|uniref:Extracellular solute-binding protein n=1 Tax=Cohnella nanjingensis TaxID=1387779 RepID=A0A7X0VF05_9BACL|nr:extracellular solute-binding protein [Cohnella nanjingensis]MBB6670119.1 extracellular solute-binding protein [Cohnella nanjingensis]